MDEDPAVGQRHALAGRAAGVPHRLESVARIGGVEYVDHCKATNVDSTIVALRSYAGGVRLIAGGRPKAQDFSALAPGVCVL